MRFPLASYWKFTVAGRLIVTALLSLTIIAVLRNGRERVVPVGEGEVGSRECAVRVAVCCQRIHRHIRGRAAGRARHCQRPAACGVSQLVQAVGAKRIGQRVVDPVTEVARRIVIVTELFIEPGGTSRFLAESCFQLANQVVRIVDRVGERVGHAPPLARQVVAVRVRVEQKGVGS